MKTAVWFALGGNIIAILMLWSLSGEFPIVALGVGIGILLGAYAQEVGQS